ncbi:MAG: hypothetical protein ACKOYN_03335 [Planctomycetota bacterium]
MNCSLRTSLMLLSIAVIALGLTVWKLALPAFEESERRMLEAGRLLALSSQETALRSARDRVRGELERVVANVRSTVRAIPTEPDQAHLMRMLSVGASDEVGSQTIVAGDPVPAINADSTPFQAVPVTVEMEATFARVMQVLARAERDARLVRPLHVSILRPADGGNGSTAKEGPRFVDAKIELDVVFGSAFEGATR